MLKIIEKEKNIFDINTLFEIFIMLVKVYEKKVSILDAFWILEFSPDPDPEPLPRGKVRIYTDMQNNSYRLFFDK